MDVEVTLQVGGPERRLALDALTTPVVAMRERLG